jgi:hypothetical protein
MHRPWLIALLLGLVAAPAAAQAPRRQPVDDAVARGLAFLAKMQEEDGSWTAPNGRSPAITSLAVMAFLSAGHVPGEGPYGPAVEKGVRWVLNAQQQNGLLGPPGYQEMYHHGICTLMLAEVAGMTDGALSRQVKARLEKAVAFILAAQRRDGPARGGWRYRASDSDADMSVTGWQLLALRAAKNLGCDVPAERIDRAVDFVKRCHEPRTGAFCYTPSGRPTLPCTGTGILCLEICGKGRHRSRDALQAGALLLKQDPGESFGHFCYGIYYCSQALFQLGKNYWSSYRPRLHKVLLDRQEANGAWLLNDGPGPSYATAMCVLALTVEYRFLPIYQRDEGPEGE